MFPEKTGDKWQRMEQPNECKANERPTHNGTRQTDAWSKEQTDARRQNSKRKSI